MICPVSEMLIPPLRKNRCPANLLCRGAFFSSEQCATRIRAPQATVVGEGCSISPLAAIDSWNASGPVKLNAVIIRDA